MGRQLPPRIRPGAPWRGHHSSAPMPRQEKSSLRRNQKRSRSLFRFAVRQCGANPAGPLRDFVMEFIGRKHWAIAEGYIPSESSFSDPALVSHETACILNAGDAPAQVQITVFFADREPVGPYLVTVEPRRTLHLRFNDLDRPAPI